MIKSQLPSNQQVWWKTSKDQKIYWLLKIKKKSQRSLSKRLLLIDLTFIKMVTMTKILTVKMAQRKIKTQIQKQLLFLWIRPSKSLSNEEIYLLSKTLSPWKMELIVPLTRIVPNNSFSCSIKLTRTSTSKNRWTMLTRVKSLNWEAEAKLSKWLQKRLPLNISKLNSLVQTLIWSWRDKLSKNKNKSKCHRVPSTTLNSPPNSNNLSLKSLLLTTQPPYKTLKVKINSKVTSNNNRMKICKILTTRESKERNSFWMVI